MQNVLPDLFFIFILLAVFREWNILTFLGGSASVSVTIFKLTFFKNSITSVNGGKIQEDLKAKYQS